MMELMQRALEWHRKRRNRRMFDDVIKGAAVLDLPCDLTYDAALTDRPGDTVATNVDLFNAMRSGYDATMRAWEER